MICIEEYLEHGSDRAIKAEELCSLLGVNQRELGRLIQSARMRGKPVCSSVDSYRPGYFLGSREDVERNCRQLRHRAITSLRTYKALKLSTVPDNQLDFMEDIPG